MMVLFLRYKKERLSVYNINEGYDAKWRFVTVTVTVVK